MSNEKNLPNSQFKDSSTPIEQMQSPEKHRVIEEGLQCLSQDDQQLLRMRHEQGLTFVEMGNLLDTSADAARMSWGQAIEKLKNHLSIHGDL